LKIYSVELTIDLTVALETELVDFSGGASVILNNGYSGISRTQGEVIEERLNKVDLVIPKTVRQ